MDYEVDSTQRVTRDPDSAEESVGFVEVFNRGSTSEHIHVREGEEACKTGVRNVTTDDGDRSGTRGVGTVPSFTEVR